MGAGQSTTGGDAPKIPEHIVAPTIPKVEGDFDID